MCGITGYYSTKHSVPDNILERMTTSLRHRGPDADGFYYNDNRTTALGHRRLSILDLSTAANQPMHSDNGRYVIVFNGEVYNFAEIRDLLGIKPTTTSDTEIILEAFVLKGADALQLFNGMFAIAIYDKEKDELFLARDRMGVKPIYYHWDGSRLFFASEMKALLKAPISRTLNTTALADYLHLEYVAGTNTIFNEIKKLPNGSYAWADKNGLRIGTYYNLLDKLGNTTYYHQDRDSEEQFDALLSSSVQLRRISDVPVGVFLSGGTDSSVVTSKFQELSSIPVKSFTIGFDVKGYDESDYAGRVAALLKTDHTLSRVTEKDAIVLAENTVAHYDEPFAAPSTIPSLLVCKKAREHVTVALGGDGGDELFMGYGYYNWMDRITQLQKLGGSALRKTAALALTALGGNYRRVAGLLDYEEEAAFWIHVWSQEQYMFSATEISELMGRPYKHETMLTDWQKINAMPIHPYLKVSLFDIKNYLPYNLLFKMDIASMANSLEVRLPFMDYRLVEFAINLPLQYKIHKGEQKYLLKKHLERSLPTDLIYRKKWGFPSPIGQWLQGDLAFMIDKYLCKEQLEKHGLFDIKVVERLVNRFRGGDTYQYKKVWALVFFQMFYNKYVDGNQ